MEEMTEYIDQLVPVWPEDGVGAIAPTEEPYVTFTIGGIVAEGEAQPLIATSEAAACEWFLDSFLRYAIGKVGTLYWRERPHVIKREFRIVNPGAPDEWDKHAYFSIWARLLISDKPVLEKE